MRNVVPLIVYTRRDCPLCAEAEQTVEAFAARFPLSVDVRDVDGNAAWRQNWGMEVPVVFLGDTKLFRFRIEPAAFEAAIVAYLGRDDSGDHT